MRLFNRTVINQDKKWALSIASHKIPNIICLKFVCGNTIEYCRFDVVQNIFLDTPPCQCRIVLPDE